MTAARGKLRGRLAGFRAAKHTYVCPRCVRLVPKDGCGEHKPQHCASVKEAKRYIALLLMQLAGAIRYLEPQPRYKLEVNGVPVGTYIADFRYQERRGPYWQSVVEDCKGNRRFGDEASALRRRLAEILHCIVVRIV